jgi:hypothetical protein
VTRELSGPRPHPSATVHAAALAARPAPSLGEPLPGRPDPTPVRFVQPLDDGLRQWMVVEVDARAMPGAHGAACLLFSCADRVRRVWDYPADWRALDTAGLVALSWRR